MTYSQRGYGEADTGSDARPVSRGGMVTLSRGELYDLTTGLQAKARRAFVRGMVVGFVLTVAGMFTDRAFGGTEQPTALCIVARSTSPAVSAAGAFSTGGRE